ncbi:VirC2 family conjugal transfer protein [Notoacmeibacter sp. MSK16QG-6]|uniref:VirC2 family conjugal transfer protein n=1 Tax=Notoacmeibacter sp. MSK16QG-6 TaxID=2957982 RepID=UPI00209D5982|nr:VirC2 family conjugal transfer protein [Notoacmeibacter sp. MSK16QG-6]MCP1200619.1 VirC2 family conjugal transfer protein [Notoacmeibacter sp. MSK16QG-6]
MAIRKPRLSVAEARTKASASDPQSTSSAPPRPRSDLAARQPSEPVRQRIESPPTPAPSSPPLPAAVPEPAMLRPIDDAEPEPKVQVFVSALLPAKGVSPSFDMLCRQYRPSKALQMILRRALDDYEGLLQSGAHKKCPSSYETVRPSEQGALIQTSRMMPVALVSVARNHFDPLGLESTRAFGRKLASTALASFFRAEAERAKRLP